MKHLSETLFFLGMLGLCALVSARQAEPTIEQPLSPLKIFGPTSPHDFIRIEGGAFTTTATHVDHYQVPSDAWLIIEQIYPHDGTVASELREYYGGEDCLLSPEMSYAYQPLRGRMAVPPDSWIRVMPFAGTDTFYIPHVYAWLYRGDL